MNDDRKSAAEMARHFLAWHHEPAREDSRLFQDLQHFAARALETVRRWRLVRGSTKFPGETRGNWPVIRPKERGL
jgi:hypothetical protein